MSYKKIITLSVIAILLGGLYFGYLKPYFKGKRLIAELQHKFFRADTSDIDYIRIQVGTEPPYTLKKTPRGWKIVSPDILEPDHGAVEFFLKTLSKGKALKVVGHTMSLPDFGMGELYAVIAIGYRGTIEILKLGGENPAKTGHYALSESLKTVFLIESETARHLYVRLHDMREKRIFPYQKESIHEIIIERQDTTLDFVRSADGWLMRKPVRFKADNAEVDRLLEIMITQKAEDFFKWNQEVEDLKRIINIKLMDIQGNIISRGELRYWGTEWNKQAVFRKDDHPQEALRVSRDFWLNLDHHPSWYADKSVFNGIGNNQIKRLTVRHEDDEFILEKSGEKWLYNGRVYEQQDIQFIIDEVLRMKFERLFFNKRFKPELPVFEVKVYTDRDVQRLRVYKVDVRKEVTSSYMFVTGVPGVSSTRPVYFWLAEKNGLSYQAVVTSEQIMVLKEALREYVAE